MALPARNHDEPSPAALIERSAELKRALVGFALSPRFERQMERFVLESGSGEIPDEGEAIDAIDRFALQHTLPKGKTVLDEFLASRPDLTAADREMLPGWYICAVCLSTLSDGTIRSLRAAMASTWARQDISS